MRKLVIVMLLFAGLLIGGSAGAVERVSNDPPLQKAWTLFNMGKYRQVISILEPLAAKGNPEAQTLLGECYETGLGVAPNPAVAAEWYKLAAEAGEAEAMARLGYAYVVGSGVPKDFNMALQWIVKAAEKGNQDAMGTLEAWNREGRLN